LCPKIQSCGIPSERGRSRRQIEIFGTLNFCSGPWELPKGSTGARQFDPAKLEAASPASTTIATRGSRTGLAQRWLRTSQDSHTAAPA